MNIYDEIRNGQSQSEDLIKKSLPIDIGTIVEDIKKAKAAQIGEIRTWSGVKMRKEANGWVPVKDGSKGSVEAEEGKEGSQEPQTIEDAAKSASETALTNATKMSSDPKVREAAHKELLRRKSEEAQETFKAPEGAEGKKESSKANDENNGDATEMKQDNPKKEEKKTPEKKEDGKQKPSELEAGKTYTYTEPQESGEILTKGDKFKISSDKKSVSVYNKEDKVWDNYKFDEIFPDDSSFSVKGQEDKDPKVESYSKGMESAIQKWMDASEKNGGDTDVPEGDEIDAYLDKLMDIEDGDMGQLGETIGETLSYLEPGDKEGMKYVMKVINKKLNKHKSKLPELKAQGDKLVKEQEGKEEDKKAESKEGEDSEEDIFSQKIKDGGNMKIKIRGGVKEVTIRGIEPDAGMIYVSDKGDWTNQKMVDIKTHKIIPHSEIDKRRLEGEVKQGLASKFSELPSETKNKIKEIFDKGAGKGYKEPPTFDGWYVNLSSYGDRFYINSPQGSSFPISDKPDDNEELRKLLPEIKVDKRERVKEFDLSTVKESSGAVSDIKKSIDYGYIANRLKEENIDIKSLLK